MTAREITPAELADDVRDLTASIDALRSTIENLYVRKDVYDLAHRQLEVQVATIEARQTLIGRTAVTALLLPVLTAVMVALIIGGFR